jgi:penicillin-binding protein 1C
MARGLLVLGAAALTLIAATALLDRVFPPDLSRYDRRSPELLDAAGRPLNIATAPDGNWRLAIAPEQVSPRYLDMLLATEDRRFWRHPGIDPVALARALWQLARHGHVVSGGSTLTMQVARLLTPHPHDLAGKLHDMARAVQLECHFSKREILAMYLTLAPFGGNIEGVRAASLIYFDREPATLTDDQAALLVALPQSPTRLRPDRHLAHAASAQRKLFARLRPAEQGVPLQPVLRHPLPALAPHLAQRLAGAADGAALRTTIDGALQQAAEGLLRRERRWLGDDANPAALVVRNEDRAVLAYVGGTDYFGPGGMVDLVRARRSPGSTLKPFIYGLAFDDAVVAPDTLIDDAPLRIGDYAPQNFDRRFHGLVTAREALQQSYNLPAVALLSEIGPARFAAALRQAGASLALPQGGEPGLPLALGGVGISLEDLAALYVALADGGRAARLRLLAQEPPAPATPLMTEMAALQVGDILEGTPRPDGVSPAGPRAIAYKTGTSYGFRDAWAVGYSHAYTVAVWVGRGDGSPRPGSFGRDTAAPILFRLFDLLPAEPDAPALHARAAGDTSSRLAPALRRHRPRGAAPTAADTSPLSVVFPPDGALVELARVGTTPAPVALEASGGVPPYRWAVDGMPLASAPVGAASTWRPDGPGFFRLSVSDRDGHAVSEQVRLR